MGCNSTTKCEPEQQAQQILDRMAEIIAHNECRCTAYPDCPALQKVAFIAAKVQVDNGVRMLTVK